MQSLDSFLVRFGLLGMGLVLVHLSFLKESEFDLFFQDESFLYQFLK